MPEFTPAQKGDNGAKINRGLTQAMYPDGARVQNEPTGRPEIVVEFLGTGGHGVVLSIQGAAVLARELRKTVHAYLNPEIADKSDPQETK